MKPRIVVVTAAMIAIVAVTASVVWSSGFSGSATIESLRCLPGELITGAHNPVGPGTDAFATPQAALSAYLPEVGIGVPAAAFTSAETSAGFQYRHTLNGDPRIFVDVEPNGTGWSAAGHTSCQAPATTDPGLSTADPKTRSN